jgi:hypothetical protein
VRHQDLLVEGDQQGRVVQAHHAERFEERVADQEVAVAGHEADRPLPCRLAEHVGAARLEIALGDVVADPDLE